MPDSPTLYWNIISQPARTVKALLDIGKIDYKLISVDLFKMEQRSPSYLTINPMGTVPTLIHKGMKITESIAILTYLCETYQSIPSTFYGKSPQERATVNQYLSWCQSYLRPSLGALFILQKQIGLRRGKPLPFEKVAAAEAKILQALKTLDQLIGDKNYLANGRPTIADLMIYFEVTILVYHGKDHYSYPNINRWFINIYSIPEVKMVTHQWFSIAQQFAKILSELPVKKASL